MQLIIFALLFLSSCSFETPLNESKNAGTLSEEKEVYFSDPIQLDSLKEFSREGIRERIDSIQKVGGDLYVHCLVPLCDNDNQGIVKVSQSLGDGLNLRTNLYWATGHGMKAYFQKSSKWKTIKIYNPESDDILERAVFRSKIGNSTVYLITDAYRGDRMKECLEDYFRSLAGGKNDSLIIDSLTVYLNSKADLIGFNGHNGLMDVPVDKVVAVDNREKDAVAIGCISNSYFKPYFFQARAFPLVMTTGLMYPGAFIFDDIIQKWAINATDLEIKYAAGDAYNRVMKCGQRGGRNLFSTGWEG
ncbi:MAG: hypothetical protein R2799_09605 [Crocinitomicaceae bacterium]